MQSKRVVYALTTRKTRGGIAVEVLLQRRPANASLMADMLELPQIALSEPNPANLLLSEEPVLRVRHAIVGTNFYVEVLGIPTRRETRKRALRKEMFEWIALRELLNQPLTGLTRKVLQRLKLMKAPAAEFAPGVPLLIGRGGRAATFES